MLTAEEIERLAKFDGEDSRVLSVYLDLDPSSDTFSPRDSRAR